MDWCVKPVPLFCEVVEFLQCFFLFQYVSLDECFQDDG